MQLVEKHIQMSQFDTNSKTARVNTFKVWVPTDGTHDMGGVVLAFLAQIAEIRNKFPVAKEKVAGGHIHFREVEQ